MFSNAALRHTQLSVTMYKPETSYDEFLKKEQEKYPELILKDIQELTELVKTNNDLPSVPGTIFQRWEHLQLFNIFQSVCTVWISKTSRFISLIIIFDHFPTLLSYETSLVFDNLRNWYRKMLINFAFNDFLLFLEQ